MSYSLEYMRKWRAANRAKMNATRRTHYATNKERIAAWRQANREKLRARVRAWHDSRREQSRAESAAWRKANLEYVAALCAKYRGRRKEGACSCCAPWSFKFIYAQARSLKMHVDHIRPLAKGGMHCLKNLQLLEPLANRQKSARWEQASA